ncbi:Alpha/Beta hydrolase protein [Boletus edulis]|uniref:Alpha/Beta hydrolase protein n=1 Tax=Boletus edulis BED1 TaxID=1328754 RepID=A0AAD4GLP6_BOLED|nr:Alpha/Beta hydrolase protein [Boletus edulis]KAF8451161.1 Alpha/Beta hydrolase protein [Boletus edulis BED1]
MTPVPSATQWGSPAASKRAFLIHGNTCSSHTWETVAQSLAKAGFLVTAPNMLGHGNRSTGDFHLQTFAQDLYSTYFTNEFTYDVIIGHSLGGTVALALLPMLPTPRGHNTAVILVDPGIKFSDEVLDGFEKRYGTEIQHVPSVEAYVADHPTWTRQDAVSRVVGLHMAQSELPKRIFEHIKPFVYTHLFSAIPQHVEMTVLVADPALSSVCPPELVPAHPQIRKVTTVKGSSHWVQHDNPGAIVKTAVDEVERLERIAVHL